MSLYIGKLRLNNCLRILVCRNRIGQIKVHICVKLKGSDFKTNEDLTNMYVFYSVNVPQFANKEDFAE